MKMLRAWLASWPLESDLKAFAEFWPFGLLAFCTMGLQVWGEGEWGWRIGGRGVVVGIGLLIR